MQPSPSRATLVSLLVRLTVGAVVVGLLVAYSMYFAVSEGQAAVVTRLGKPMREITTAGPSWKLPWPIEEVHLIDRRQRLFNTPFTATFTRDKKNVILLTYVIWEVARPLAFLQTAGSAAIVEQKLDGMVTAAKNFHLGRHELSALVSTTPEEIATHEIEHAILADVQPLALEKFGVAVKQVGFKRIAFPAENVTAVLAHMRSERRAEADRLRAEGEREAQEIRNAALVRAADILRSGREEAGRLRGAAEKEAAEIYAAAHRASPEFYRFWRSLAAMKSVLGAKSTVILRTDQGFFDVLTDPALDSDQTVLPPEDLARTNTQSES